MIRASTRHHDELHNTRLGHICPEVSTVDLEAGIDDLSEAGKYVAPPELTRETCDATARLRGLYSSTHNRGLDKRCAFYPTKHSINRGNHQAQHKQTSHSSGKVCLSGDDQVERDIIRLYRSARGGKGSTAIVVVKKRLWTRPLANTPAEQLLEHVESQGGSAARRAWVNSLARRFEEEDADGVGKLEK